MISFDYSYNKNQTHITSFSSALLARMKKEEKNLFLFIKIDLCKYEFNKNFATMLEMIVSGNK